MRNRHLPTGLQPEARIAKFLDGYEWEQIYNLWRRNIQHFTVPLTPLFETVEIHLHGRSVAREPDLVWWSRARFATELQRYQNHFENYPNSLGPTHPDVVSATKGEMQTLRLLHKFDGFSEKQAAVLISASLFSRIAGRQPNYPETWPPAMCVEALDAQVRTLWCDNGDYWHHLSSSAIPVGIDDFDYRIERLPTLIRYLAEEHAALLHQWAPTLVNYTHHPNL